MPKSNDWILYAGAVAVGLYAVYVISKPLKDTAGGIATASQGLGGGISQIGLATGAGAADVLTKTSQATGGVIAATGQESAEIVHGLGGTINNTLDLSQAVSAAPLNILQRLNKAYEDLAPIDWLKHKILG
jgi:hypothetical protein